MNHQTLKQFNIEHLLNNIEDIDVKILDAYLEIKDYTINNIDEIIKITFIERNKYRKK